MTGVLLAGPKSKVDMRQIDRKDKSSITWDTSRKTEMPKWANPLPSIPSSTKDRRVCWRVIVWNFKEEEGN